MAQYLVLLILIVITDPYKNLDYNKINVYHFDNTENTVGYTESEFLEELDSEDEDEESVDETLYYIFNLNQEKK